MTQNFIVAEHNSEGRLILTVCDSNVHGKKLEEGNTVLDLGSRFYSGKEEGTVAVERLMLRAYTIHAVGKDAVAAVIKLGLAARENVKTVAGVPHVQVFVI